MFFIFFLLLSTRALTWSTRSLSIRDTLMGFHHLRFECKQYLHIAKHWIHTSKARARIRKNTLIANEQLILHMRDVVRVCAVKWLFLFLCCVCAYKILLLWLWRFVECVYDNVFSYDYYASVNIARISINDLYKWHFCCCICCCCASRKISREILVWNRWIFIEIEICEPREM